MHLHTEAKTLAQESWDEAIEFSGSTDTESLLEFAEEYLHQSIDGHEVVIYYGKAIEFCATQETSDGEDWLEDCGGIVQAGDTFGQIACRIAFATLLVASQEVLQEISNEYEESEL